MGVARSPRESAGAAARGLPAGPGPGRVVWVVSCGSVLTPPRTLREAQSESSVGAGARARGRREGAAAALGRRELPVWKRGAGLLRAVTRSLTAL